MKCNENLKEKCQLGPFARKSNIFFYIFSVVCRLLLISNYKSMVCNIRRHRNGKKNLTYKNDSSIFTNGHFIYSAHTYKVSILKKEKFRFFLNDL